MPSKEYTEEYWIPYIHCRECRYVGIPNNKILVPNSELKEELRKRFGDEYDVEEIVMWYCPVCDIVLNLDEDMDVLTYVSVKDVVELLGYEIVEEDI